MTTTSSSSNGSPSPVGGAVTVGTQVQLCVPPNPGRAGLWLWNNSAAGTISLCPSTQWSIAQGTAPAPAFANTLPAGAVTPITQGVPGTNAPGSVTLSPNQSVLIDTENMAGAWNGIASVNGAALTVLEFT